MGGGGRTSENGRRKGTATGPEGLVAISDGWADVAAPEGVAAAVPLTELDLKSRSEEPRRFVCDMGAWGGGLEAWGITWTDLRSRRSMREGRSCEGS
jgi:hypothetical protein